MLVLSGLSLLSQILLDEKNGGVDYVRGSEGKWRFNL